MEAGEQSRRYGIREGAAYAVMQGGGENYLSAFALLLHANAFQIGLLSALPQLLGTWFQLLSVKAMTRFDSRKAIILVGTAGQAAMWLPLMALPLLFPAQAPWLLIAAAVAYFAMGHFSVPAWNSLIMDLVVPDRRGAYFASRAKIIAVTGFAALCAAGFILHWTEARGAPWAGFAAIFLLAAAARVISTRYFACIDETVVPVTREAAGGLGEFLRDRGNRGFVRFLAFSGLMHVSVCIAGPYFVLYLLRDLQFSYLQYASWLSAQVLGQFIVVTPVGLDDRYVREQEGPPGDRILRFVRTDAVSVQRRLCPLGHDQLRRRGDLGWTLIELAELCIRYGTRGGSRQGSGHLEQRQCHRMVCRRHARKLARLSGAYTDRSARL